MHVLSVGDTAAGTCAWPRAAGAATLARLPEELLAEFVLNDAIVRPRQEAVVVRIQENIAFEPGPD